MTLNSTITGTVSRAEPDYFYFFQNASSTSNELIVSILVLHSGDSNDDKITVYLNQGNIASPDCYIYTCTAEQSDTGTACHIVVDPCLFVMGMWGVTVTTTGTNETQYTLDVVPRGKSLLMIYLLTKSKMNLPSPFRMAHL